MLILLPGLICDASVFAPQVRAFPDALAVQDYGGADSLEAMAQSVLDQAPPTFDLLGHSMGGRIALEIMRMAPERVSRLALVSTGVHGVKPGEADKRHALREIGRSQGAAALVDEWLPPMIGPSARTDADLVDGLRRMCIAQGQDRFEADIRALLGRQATAELLPTITCPTLVMTGQDDAWSPPDQHAEIASAIPDAELVIVPHAGHMITVEAPEAVNEAIARWLQRT